MDLHLALQAVFLFFYNFTSTRKHFYSDQAFILIICVSKNIATESKTENIPKKKKKSHETFTFEGSTEVFMFYISHSMNVLRIQLQTNKTNFNKKSTDIPWIVQRVLLTHMVRQKYQIKQTEIQKRTKVKQPRLKYQEFSIWEKFRKH